MFKVTKIDQNRLDLELSGKLGSEDMKAALDELETQSRDIENGTMLYEIVEFNLPSLGAIAIELSRLPALLGLISKFRKAAVLTDRSWLKRASELEGLVIPGLEIKAFDRDERERAELWLSE